MNGKLGPRPVHWHVMLAIAPVACAASHVTAVGLAFDASARLADCGFDIT